MNDFLGVHLSSERYKELLKAEVVLDLITRIYKENWYSDDVAKLLKPFLMPEKDGE